MEREGSGHEDTNPAGVGGSELNPPVASAEAWPGWAKALLIAIFALAIVITLPWILMWTAMASTCVPLMNGMDQMMGPRMGR
jgi:hypothetical protein